MSIGPWQILLILLIVLLLFGAGKIPRLMRDMGTGINAFKRGLKESKVADDDADQDEGPKTIKAEATAASEKAAAEPAERKAAEG